MSNATYEKLRSMRLGAMAEAYRQQLPDMTMLNLSFEERMTLLTDIEWTSRKNNRLKRLVTSARFDQPRAYMGNIDSSPRRRFDCSAVLILGNCDYIDQCLNVIILGAAGSGKSLVACALGIEACKQSYTVRFVRMPALPDDLRIAVGTGTLSKVYREYTRVNLLILDDWMLVRTTAEEFRFIYEIVHRRHKMASTILCSQFAPAGWHQRVPEETLADAIVDRIVHVSYTIQISSHGDVPSMRQKYGFR